MLKSESPRGSRGASRFFGDHQITNGVGKYLNPKKKVYPIGCEKATPCELSNTNEVAFLACELK